VADRKVQAAFQHRGLLLDARVEKGDTVSEGEVLAVLDSAKQRLVIEELTHREREVAKRLSAQEKYLSHTKECVRIGRAMARTSGRIDAARRDKATREATRAHSLHADSLLSDSRFEDLTVAERVSALSEELGSLRERLAAVDTTLIAVQEDSVQATRALLDALGAHVTLQRQILREHILRAPFRGVVVRRLRQSGEVVAAGESVFEVADPGSLFFEADAGEESICAVSPGAASEVVLVSRPDAALAGTVVTVDVASKEAQRINLLTEDEENREYLVRVRLNSNVTWLHIGMRGYARIAPSAPH
jgi:multidrug resistance efflux pump